MYKNIFDTELVDISTIMVKQDLPKQEKLAEYIRQIRNPYRYKCGKFEVTARFLKNGPTIEDCLQGIIA